MNPTKHKTAWLRIKVMAGRIENQTIAKIKTCAGLYPAMRPQAVYRRSLELLAYVIRTGD